MIWVICKRLIHSSANVVPNYDLCLLLNFTHANFRAATRFQIHPSMGPTQAIFAPMADLLPPVLQPKNSFVRGLLIRSCSPTCANKPEAHQCRLSTASYQFKYSTPMIPDTGLFHVGTHHCGSYLGHLHTHTRTFGACLPANTHRFPTGMPVCASPQFFWHTKKLMFGGTPAYIPHPPIKKDPHRDIFLSTSTISQ
ncbi:hypothetical protein O181_038216 [Austropuccinia psidii MF-1]|uniref:Uncharacterized protein n=1 Tax=Austropuccinia psidii MF-1 TaxID=1389203 RepID=A0A9Q3DDK6_9BASI|nr:hypothetical protein [Austropuccinia psidii MF-1]